MRIAIHTVYSAPVEYVPIDGAVDAPIITVEDTAGGVFEIIHCESADDMNTAIFEAQLSFGGDLPIVIGG